eukprot:6183290-Pleurochrysis_carterae.AAC.2
MMLGERFKQSQRDGEELVWRRNFRRPSWRVNPMNWAIGQGRGRPWKEYCEGMQGVRCINGVLVKVARCSASFGAR